jgi:stress response protein SCP2
VAVCLSGGDVTLDKPTKFKSFPRKLRRLLCQGLYSLLVTSPEKVSDVSRYQEMWKRLGEKLHPYEFGLTQVNELFDLARGDKTQKSLQGRIEEAFLAKNWPLVMSLATKAPGVLFRSVDRALVAGCPPATLLGALEETVGKVSCRVLLSLREHLLNRERRNATGKRVFSNTKGKSWIEDETRNPLPGVVVEGLINLLDLEIEARLPTLTNLAVDMKVKGVALPLSEKNKASGFGVLQRGSVSKIEGNVLRFFMYWKEKETRTDYDLSCILLNRDFEMTSQCSYTSLRGTAMVHSGDITTSKNGATEFIDVDLRSLPTEVTYIVPQVYVFAGEDFEGVEEAFFGFMERTHEQKGLPFEPSTVALKSDLRGKGKISLPLMFFRTTDGNWWAKWVHLYSTGMPSWNRVEENHLSTSLQIQGVFHRIYLDMAYLTRLLRKKAVIKAGEPQTYIGLQAPEGVYGKTYTPANFSELIPE